jgi:hypothetical protein
MHNPLRKAISNDLKEFHKDLGRQREINRELDDVKRAFEDFISDVNQAAILYPRQLLHNIELLRMVEDTIRDTGNIINNWGKVHEETV